MMAQKVEISEALVNRFAAAFARFAEAAQEALSQAELDPQFAVTAQFQAWQHKALPFIEQQNVSIQNAASLYLVGEANPILAQAAEKRGLAKQLDGFDLTFAGPDQAKMLDRLETSVVIAAYQLCVAARIP
jgi:hypothetical protein